MDAFAAQRTHGLQTPKKLIVELSSPESTPAGVTPSHPPSGLSNDSALPESPGIPISAYDGEDMAMFNHLASHSSRQYSTRAAAVVSSQVGESMLQSLIIVSGVSLLGVTVLVKSNLTFLSYFLLYFYCTSIQLPLHITSTPD